MSSLSIKNLNNDLEKWSESLRSFSNPGAAHMPGWGEIIKRAYGWETIYLAAEKDSEIKGLLPVTLVKSKIFGRKAVSMPYLNDGGILATDNETEKLLWAEVMKIMDKENMASVELRQAYNIDLGVTPYTEKISMILDLSGGDENVWMEKLHRNVRNKIRKSEKMGIEVREGKEWLDAFYNMHVINMHDLGSPAHRFSFFRQIMDVLKDSVKLYVAILGDEIIGGKLVCYFHDTVYFLWVSSPKKYMNYAAVSLMDWIAIKDAIKAGLRVCDFGRSTADSTHFQFKKKWGAEVQQLYWQIYPEVKVKTDDGDHSSRKLMALSKIWRKMPISLVRILGPMLRGGLPQ